jgi:hypothetical protein
MEGETGPGYKSATGSSQSTKPLIVCAFGRQDCGKVDQRLCPFALCDGDELNESTDD